MVKGTLQEQQRKTRQACVETRREEARPRENLGGKRHFSRPKPWVQLRQMSGDGELNARQPAWRRWHQAPSRPTVEDVRGNMLSTSPTARWSQPQICPVMAALRLAGSVNACGLPSVRRVRSRPGGAVRTAALPNLRFDKDDGSCRGLRYRRSTFSARTTESGYPEQLFGIRELHQPQLSRQPNLITLGHPWRRNTWLSTRHFR